MYAVASYRRLDDGFNLFPLHDDALLGGSCRYDRFGWAPHHGLRDRLRENRSRSVQHLYRVATNDDPTWSCFRGDISRRYGVWTFGSVCDGCGWGSVKLLHSRVQHLSVKDAGLLLMRRHCIWRYQRFYVGYFELWHRGNLRRRQFLHHLRHWSCGYRRNVGCHLGTVDATGRVLHVRGSSWWDILHRWPPGRWIFVHRSVGDCRN